MSKFECPKCKSKKFVLTEVVTTVTSILLDLSKGEDSPTAYFKENQVTRQYTLICCDCGNVLMLNEGEYIDNIFPLFGEDGVGYDVVQVIEEIFSKGKISKYTNSNISVEEEK